MRVLAEVGEHTALPAEFREWQRDQAPHWKQLRERLDGCDARIEALTRQDQRCARLRAIIHSMDACRSARCW